MTAKGGGAAAATYSMIYVIHKSSQAGNGIFVASFMVTFTVCPLFAWDIISAISLTPLCHCISEDTIKAIGILLPGVYIKSHTVKWKKKRVLESLTLEKDNS